ncbi:hypothetical protein BC830DRAFT_1230763 [Chytriomyces sp. MP71]|nr:hypothetical protein BC830DRAFT_1230763 [Chytriomyces sp. MP71]
MSASKPLADLLLEGVRCPKSPLHVLSRNWDAVRLILDAIESQLHNAIDWQVTGASHVGKVDFPPPLKHEDGVSFQEIYFNMMPFLMPAKHWYEADKPLPTLPPALHRYSDMIRQCLEFCPGEAEKVCYITVEEGWVNASVAQRRPGLHTDSPGAPSHELVSKCELVMPWHHWGFGMVMKHVCEGGIFIASNTTDSCRVYDCVLKDPSVVGKLGDLEHMRHVLDRGPRRCDLKSKKQLREEREEWPPYPPKKENSTRHNSNSTYPAQVRWRGHRVHMRPVVERQTAMDPA